MALSEIDLNRDIDNQTMVLRISRLHHISQNRRPYAVESLTTLQNNRLRGRQNLQKHDILGLHINLRKLQKPFRNLRVKVKNSLRGCPYF